jgi:hypothetical protein
LQVHPLTGERAIMLGYFVRGLLGVSSADSAHLFAMLRDHVTRLENTVRWRWSAGDVVIWDNCATQHKAIDDYGDQPRIVRRVTIDGPVSVGIDGRHGQKTQQRRSGRRGGLKEIPVAPESPRCTSVAARPLRQSRFGAPWKLFASGGMIDAPPASRRGPPRSTGHHRGVEPAGEIAGRRRRSGSAGNQPPGRVCHRRRALRLGQAGRGGGRRDSSGRHGRLLGAMARPI